jgi:hypothetical protein
MIREIGIFDFETDHPLAFIEIEVEGDMDETDIRSAAAEAVIIWCSDNGRSYDGDESGEDQGVIWEFGL